MKHGFLIVFGLFFVSVSVFAQKTKPKSEISYNLESVFISGQKNTISKDKPALVFDANGKTAKCITSCNYIDLKYLTKKNKFKFTSVIPGSVPCPDHLLGLELDLKENFLKVNSYLIQNSKIYFFNKKDTLIVFYE
ncbi:MAG: META domain-containing protein [Bacteroidota bacterium]